MALSLRPILVVLALAAFTPALGEAQERPPADTAQVQPSMPGTPQQMQQMQGMMPMVTEMMLNVTRSSMEAMAAPETAQNLARFTRNYYEALVAEGFTEEQALHIVSAMGFPPLPQL